MKNLALDDSKWPPRQAKNYINSQKDEGRRAAHIEVGISDIFEQTMLRVSIKLTKIDANKLLVDLPNYYCARMSYG